MGYLEKAWYFAGWSEDVKVGEVKELVVCERELAVCRTESGAAMVVGDRCPHRFAPLHLGKVRGETIECPYHGMRFGPDGRCSHNPHGGISSALSTPSYAVIERDGCIWFWLSLTTAPDPALVPDMTWLSDVPATAVGRLPTLHVKADYKLFIDNLFDPVHADYIHASTVGGSGLFNTVRPEVRTDGYKVEATWDFGTTEVLPVHRKRLAEHEQVETLFGSTLWAPTVVLVWSVIKPAGSRWEDGIRAGTYHILTPAKAGMTTYDVANVRSYDLDDVEQTRATAELTGIAFSQEDKPMMEAMHKVIGANEFWDLKPALQPIDQACSKARRSLDMLIEKEAA